ncbi:hypothetical protein LR48_Vigan03g016700 [Vigna angularis]|uniref:Uncharacterized protein n=1 Tax=Phaseolus angularis TaxID=3914 RepID=A0A0L9U1Y9_PHAAN|nr:hypothetical protein LR48_Vigan03g016700 [Vigna angularis]
MNREFTSSPAVRGPRGRCAATTTACSVDGHIRQPGAAEVVEERRNPYSLAKGDEGHNVSEFAGVLGVGQKEKQMSISILERMLISVEGSTISCQVI